MPVNFLATVAKEGTSAIPHYDRLKYWIPSALAISGLKYYFAGPRNTWSRDMHGRVVLMTGGTSGLGAAVAQELARGGAQLVLLVHKLDGWTTEYVEDLREATGNTTVFAEECNLDDFMSVRKFATKWIDNSPPRRLDMVVCCAATATPPFVNRQASEDGIEKMMQINYLAHIHLLNILAPALRSQPPDRDVRVILTSCIANVMGVLDLDDIGMEQTVYNKKTPWRILGASKLALSLWAMEFQRQLNGYVRKDEAPNNVHVAIVDPGMMRSPSLKRFLSCGSLFGLLIYLILWPIWWIFLRTSIDGSQSILHAAMNPEIADLKECAYVSDSAVRQMPPRKEFKDQEYQKMLMKKTNELIEKAEKRTAIERKRHETAKPKTAPKAAPKAPEAPKPGSQTSFEEALKLASKESNNEAIDRAVKAHSKVSVPVPADNLFPEEKSAPKSPDSIKPTVKSTPETAKSVSKNAKNTAKKRV